MRESPRRIGAFVTDDTNERRHDQTWRVRERRLVLDADPWLRVWSEDLELPNGREVDEFFTIEMPDYVVVVAVTDDGLIVTERGYKHGARRICVSLPAGFVEPGEDPAEAARRELLEETGYCAQRWESLGSFINDGNRGSGEGHLYLARGARRVADPDSGDLETVSIELVSLNDLLAATRRGEVGDIPNAAAIGLAASQLLRETGSLPGQDC
jgi:ADP-ribose pyrophosphatase